MKCGSLKWRHGGLSRTECFIMKQSIINFETIYERVLWSCDYFFCSTAWVSFSRNINVLSFPRNGCHFWSFVIFMVASLSCKISSLASACWLDETEVRHEIENFLALLKALFHFYSFKLSVETTALYSYWPRKCIQIIGNTTPSLFYVGPQLGSLHWR